MFSVKIIEHSRHAIEGTEVVTFEVSYWRAIHGELLTHRQFSRNASSSRAIPIERMLKMVEENPAMPMHWGKNKSGMQADVEIPKEEQDKAKAIWLEAAKNAVESSRQLLELGVHKQVANRVTEPFQYIKVLISTTELDNFYNLRDHPDAQPEIQALAQEMKKALKASKPTILKKGEWHLPYVTKEERETLDTDLLPKLSSARCARVSYNNFDGTNANVEKDLLLFDKLAGSDPIHASALEHPCKAMFGRDYHTKPTNFRDFLQYRRIVEKQLES